MQVQFLIVLWNQTSERKSLAEEWHKNVLIDSITCRDCRLTGHTKTVQIVCGLKAE